MSTVTDSPAAPDRSLAQRLDALGHANEIRSKRAALKRDLKAGRASIHTLLLDPPEFMETAKVFDILLVVPKYGRVKATKVLQVCRISPSKTIAGLSERQRAELIVRIRPTTGHVTPETRATPANGQHMQALGLANSIRLCRADLKHMVREGETTVADVLADCPSAAKSMTITELLMSQHNWGRTRSRRFLLSIPMTETKAIGSLTMRQRIELITRLGGVSGP